MAEAGWGRVRVAWKVWVVGVRGLVTKGRGCWGGVCLVIEGIRRVEEGRSERR